MVEYYDKGYLLAGRFGYNYPTYCWLIKTDINGDEIWRKVFGYTSDNLVITADVAFNKAGDIYLVGSFYYYNENDYDPIIMKLNSCGEKVWCRVFYEDGLNYSDRLVITSDGGCVAVLKYMSTDLQKDRICLTKFNPGGEMQWKQCYNSQDTNIYNEDAQDLIITPDYGFLITGYCDYVDPNPPHYWYYKPYYIKTDSAGNFEWETVVHSELSDTAGQAWNTVVNPDSTYFYSSMSHNYYSSRAEHAPALLKMDLNGNVINIYDLAPANYYGYINNMKFVTDSTLAASAVWGGGSGYPKAVIIDTLGNIIKQTTPLENDWMGHVEITFDKKILYQTNLNEDDDFSTYLFKLNQNLESDTVYTQPFTYDSLCDGEIVSDTITLDDCGLIVGVKEIYTPKSEPENKVIIYPNPAKDRFKVQCLMFEVGDATIEVFDLFGRKMEQIEVPKGQTEIEVNTRGWKKGLYMVRVTGKSGRVSSGKVVLE